MVNRRNKKKMFNSDDSKVKLYKTHQGWMSSLDRFFKLLAVQDKNSVKAKNVDPDALDESKLSDTTEAYIKGLSAMTAVLGGSAMMTGNAFADTNIQKQADLNGEQVLGTTSQTESTSASVSNQNSSTVESLTENSTSQSRTYSESNLQSNSNSTNSTSTSNASTSESNSTSTTSGSTSSSTSSSSSASGSTASNSTSTSSSSSTSGSTSSSTASTSSSTQTSLSGSKSSTSGSASGSTDSLNTSAASSTVNSMASTTLGKNVNLAGAATLTVNGQTIQEGKGQKLTAKQLANLFGTSLVQKQQTEIVTSKDNGGVDVSTVAEFQKAIQDKNVTNINLVGNIDFSNYGYGQLNISHSLNINANGYKMYFNGNKAGSTYFRNNSNNIAISNSTADTTTEVTVKNADIYTSSSYGAFRPLSNPGNTNLVLENTNITGGTAVRSETVGQGQNKVTIKGTVNINAASSYQAENGTDVNTYFWANPNDSQGTSQLYIANGVDVSDGATLNMNANGLTAYNIDARDNIHAHEFTVGNNATVNMEGSTTGNVIMNQPIAGNGWNQGNSFTVGDNSNINMKSSNFNVYMNNGVAQFDSGYMTTVTIGKSNVNLSIDEANGAKNSDGNIVAINANGYYTVAGGSPVQSGFGISEITINPGATVTGTVVGDASNIIVNNKNQITIDNPNVVTFNKQDGLVYKNLVNGGSAVVDANNTNVEVTQNGQTVKSGIMSDSQASYIGQNSNNTSSTMENSEISSDLSNSLLSEVNQPTTTKVVYNGADVINSQSASESQQTSASASTSQSTAESISKSTADSESNASKSASISESEKNSTSQSISKQNSTSKSISESQSSSKSLSASLSDSASLSKDASQSTSSSLSTDQSKSNSESVKNSQSTSTSIKNSEEASSSLSTSLSGSLSGSQSESTSLSDSASKSESIKNSEDSSLSTSL
ncbi:serine-rich glycoprotein adhesin, partial [Limosilactobacillus agrestimuris]|uniref:serine-rich glycoprotein adhesin n=1 Tax=Limosilactobacillus agrestimuris TaxID=2941331 RepID=UPI00204140B2